MKEVVLLMKARYSFDMQKKKRFYTIEIIQEVDGKNYYVVVPALPGCFSQGQTIEQAKKNASKAIQLHIHSLRKGREPIPEDVTTFQTSIQIAA